MPGRAQRVVARQGRGRRAAGSRPHPCSTDIGPPGPRPTRSGFLLGLRASSRPSRGHARVGGFSPAQADAQRFLFDLREPPRPRACETAARGCRAPHTPPPGHHATKSWSTDFGPPGPRPTRNEFGSVPRRAVPRRPVPCRAAPCRAVPCSAVPCPALPCPALPCPDTHGRQISAHQGQGQRAAGFCPPGPRPTRSGFSATPMVDGYWPTKATANAPRVLLGLRVSSRPSRGHARVGGFSPVRAERSVFVRPSRAPPGPHACETAGEGCRATPHTPRQATMQSRAGRRLWPARATADAQRILVPCRTRSGFLPARAAADAQRVLGHTHGRRILAHQGPANAPRVFC